ncbi:MAG TPA: hypothetical protein VFI31_03910 [Pirellulales bacterium]|nr:hypothetical protein [Pirellulales bacterium]
MVIRRWFQFSLRGFLIVLTGFAVWLGWKVERARKQAEAVKAIESVGGVVQYDWQGDVSSWAKSSESWGPRGYSPAMRYAPSAASPSSQVWWQRLAGEHFFQNVRSVVFRSRLASFAISTSRPQLIDVSCRDASPSREVELLIPQLHNLPDLDTIYLQGNSEQISEEIEDRLKGDFSTCRIVRESVVTAVDH